MKIKRKTGFTMIELIIVIIIIGILIGFGVWKLGNIGTDRYHAQRCVNALYGKLSQFIMEAKTSKIPNGQNQIPDAYIFDMIDDDKLITGFALKYKYENNNILSKDIYLRDIEGCGANKNSKYIILGETDISSGTMLPKLQGKGNQAGFLLNTNKQIFTGEVKFNFCLWKSPSNNTSKTLKDSVNCSNFAKFIIDTRTGIFKRSYCKKFEDNANKRKINQQECEERYSN